MRRTFTRKMSQVNWQYFTFFYILFVSPFDINIHRVKCHDVLFVSIFDVSISNKQPDS